MDTNTGAVGVIGFGVMGSHMARNLAAKGHRVLGSSRTPSKVIEQKIHGVSPCTLEELARSCSCVLLSVTDGRAVQSILFGDSAEGAEGLSTLLAPGSLVINTTTIAPSEAADFDHRLSARDIYCVDAPVTGGDVGARNATLTIMCGGHEEAINRALPFLHCIGSKIVRVGPPGFGQRMKAVNQVGVALGIVAMTEALVLAEQQGISPDVALDILQGGAAGSWAFSNYAPRLLSNDLKPGFSAAHMLKDLKIAATEMPKSQILPGTETALRLFEKLVQRGKELGNHALIEIYRDTQI